jgi:hypothetical protein
MDSINFCDYCDISQFKEKKIITVQAQEGEINLMNYKIRDFTQYEQPFKLTVSISKINKYKIDYSIKVKFLRGKQ